MVLKLFMLILIKPQDSARYEKIKPEWTQAVKM